MLAIDIATGKEHLKLTSKAKTEDISEYFKALIIDSLDYDELWIFLDNNSTHKDKMKCQFQTKLNLFYQTHNILQLPKISFYHTPAYSPDYNLAEYIIRLIRQILLHHLPINTNLETIQNRLTNYFQTHHLQTPDQIQNILTHILNLGMGRE